LNTFVLSDSYGSGNQISVASKGNKKVFFAFKIDKIESSWQVCSKELVHHIFGYQERFGVPSLMNVKYLKNIAFLLPRITHLLLNEDSRESLFKRKVGFLLRAELTCYLLLFPIHFEPRWRTGPPHSFSNDSCLVLQYASHSRIATLLWTSPFPLYVATLSLAYPSFSSSLGPMSGL